MDLNQTLYIPNIKKHVKPKFLNYKTASSVVTTIRFLSHKSDPKRDHMTEQLTSNPFSCCKASLSSRGFSIFVNVSISSTQARNASSFSWKLLQLFNSPIKVSTRSGMLFARDSHFFFSESHLSSTTPSWMNNMYFPVFDNSW